MDNVLTRFFEQLRGAGSGSDVPVRSELKEPAADLGTRTPTADAFESDSQILLVVDLPGCNRDDIEVALTGDTLTVWAPIGELDPGYAWRRSFSLPRNIDAARAHASWALGVLKVELPRHKPEARRIPISAAA